MHIAAKNLRILLDSSNRPRTLITFIQNGKGWIGSDLCNLKMFADYFCCFHILLYGLSLWSEGVFKKQNDLSNNFLPYAKYITRKICPRALSNLPQWFVDKLTCLVQSQGQINHHCLDAFLSFLWQHYFRPYFSYTVCAPANCSCSPQTMPF